MKDSKERWQKKAAQTNCYKRDIRERVFKLANEGVYAHEIAETVGVAPSTVQRWCSAADISLRRVRRIKPSEQQAILDFHYDNPMVSQAEIAKKFDLAQSSVHHLLRTRGGLTTVRISALLDKWYKHLQELG